MKEKQCENLRLLLVGPYPPPYGGIATHLTTLIPGMFARGAQDVAIISFGDKEEVSQIDGATLYRFDTRRHLRKLASHPGRRMVAASLKTLGKEGFGVRRVVSEAVKAILINHIAEQHRSQVVSFYQSDCSLSLLPCKHTWGAYRGVMLMIFGEIYDSPNFFMKRKTFFERYLASPQAVASSSKHCACSFAKVLGISQEIEPVYLGIDLDRFAKKELREPYRAELGVTSDEILATFMGRFNEEMGIGRLLEIAPTLLEHLPKVKLLFAGAKGPFSEAVAAFAKKYQGRVHVLNNIPFELQPSIYAASDIVLAPSHDQHACMGMSIKEAMAASRPVIGSDAGGIPEAIVHGETGYLVPLDKETQHIDGEELLHCIERLASDANLREAMGIAARRRAEAIFSVERTNDRMAELFMTVMPKSGHQIGRNQF
ncbi:Spore coat protein SA [Legionella lansingensis]|uniref:Spore coat protein SA n=1 Tax=Legionella lansingensis TaxID=45067 RepID=A0A0W0VVN0_9GAMM|nr:glycosyltransferase family 4 protein [Legionella lansingensis]KTD24327.1 Spore coat protein SA [Legionella lansingensis]SNV51785.1 Spore coat protein SA [Legionella lansingensis]